MFRRIGACLLLSAFLGLGASCTRLDEPPQGEHTLGVQPLPQVGSIPADWGDLVSTSSYPIAKEWVQLWFQDDAGTVRMVAYNLDSNTLSTKAILIERR
ncbi:MAG TPA: hypothetical protein PLP83_08205 [Candidatus Aminicenantes bacterium]|nr:hypothetical protein [Candidatus Aminicenantes bacterium]